MLGLKEPLLVAGKIVGDEEADDGSGAGA